MTETDLAETEARLRERLYHLAEFAPAEPAGRAPTPSAGGRYAGPYLRRGALAAAAVLVVVGVAAALTYGNGGRDDVAVVTDGPVVGDALAYLLDPGASSPLPVSPLQARAGMVSAWTGAELLVWGGSGGASEDFADGAAFDPRVGTWRRLADGPLSARAYAAAVWTGRELLVWGGSAGGQLVGDGAAYNPVTDTWRELPKAPIGGAMKSGVVWTGKEMLVVGGLNGRGAGAAYRPATDTWRELATAPVNVAPPYPHAVWSGSEAFFLLFEDEPSIGVYDPAKDRWRLLDGGDTVGHTPLFWTGEELLAQFAAPGFSSSAYRPSDQSWRALWAPQDLPAGGTGVWTGTSTVFYDGRTSVSIYDVRTDRWQVSSVTPGINANEPAMVWADGILIVWGGTRLATPGETGSFAVSDGFMFRPPLGPDEPDASPQPVNGSATTATFMVTPSTRQTGIDRAVTGPRLAVEARLAAKTLGWEIDLPAAIISTDTHAEGSSITYAEARLALGGDAGELIVAVRVGDLDAANAGAAARANTLLRVEGNIRVYLGTDDSGAKAVEAFTEDTIVYVRSEHTTNPKTLQDLAQLAIALAHP